MPKGVPYFFREIFCLCATVCLPHRYYPTHIVMGPLGEPMMERARKGHREHIKNPRHRASEIFTPST